MRLYLVASKPTDAVTHGFLPAAARLGLDVTVLTDQPAAHGRAYADRGGHVPTLAGQPGQYSPPWIEHCDVWDHRALIAALTALPAGDGLFSNSDHLQTQTALAADYLGLPGKDWRSALRAKHKPLMRRTLARAGIEHVRVTEIRAATLHNGGDPLGAGRAGHAKNDYPVVLKPADGVASEAVVLATHADELRWHCADYFRHHPDGILMAEEFLPGTLRTMETLSDGVTRWVLGGFRTTVSPPPFFAEERLDWDPPAPADQDHVTRALDALGVSFGACHTEYMSGEKTRLIEVNDRAIGDHCEFLLAHLTGLPLFELILGVYLGERLPETPPAPPPGREHAAADYLFAQRPGTLFEAPPAARQDRAGVSVAHWPLTRAGDEIAVTGTNRDYLGVICASGPDQAAVDDAVRGLRPALDYRIRSGAAV